MVDELVPDQTLIHHLIQ